MKDNVPRKVIVKTMTVSRSVSDVFDFFQNAKLSMEAGGAAKSVVKGDDGWWTLDHISAGKSRMKHIPNRQAGVLDHVFVGAGLDRRGYFQIVPNGGLDDLMDIHETLRSDRRKVRKATSWILPRNSTVEESVGSKINSFAALSIIMA